uniref:Uncharacterized protein n=1 Tax=Arundo donax TaxID=35708 RepID=A0A0A9A8F6_ARUDO
MRVSCAITVTCILRRQRKNITECHNKKEVLCTVKIACIL